MLITPAQSISAEISVPGDKSISHRSIMLGSIAEGTTHVSNFLISQDSISTVNCFRSMGVEIVIDNTNLKIYGKGLRGLSAPKEVLNVGNSGTTARLIMGILAGQNFSSTLDGDSSIRKRPMNRVIVPLSKMGAKISSENLMPLTITGSGLQGIDYFSPIASAQVKSCVLLASLFADNKTIYTEPYKSRDHTELMLQSFGASLHIENNKITTLSSNKLYAQNISVPGDISSAAFFITLALIIPNSQLIIKNVGLNPTRTGILDIYKQMGAKITLENTKTVSNELVGDIVVSSSELKGIIIEGEIIPKLIDELPIIAVAATQAHGTTTIKDAQELKVKESNRISSIVAELKKLGAKIEETEDGMIMEGPVKLKGSTVDSHNDHRIAMSLAIAAKAAQGETLIENSECVNISYPEFFRNLSDLDSK